MPVMPDSATKCMLPRFWDLSSLSGLSGALRTSEGFGFRGLRVTETEEVSAAVFLVPSPNRKDRVGSWSSNTVNCIASSKHEHSHSTSCALLQMYINVLRHHVAMGSGTCRVMREHTR